MDRELVARLAAQRRLAARQGEAMAAFDAALRAGDDEAAHEHLAELAAAGGEAVAARGHLRLAVLSLLTPGQRELLPRELPDVLSRPWVRGVDAPGGRRVGRRRGRGGAAPGEDLP
jgi:hypothetical protein